MFDRRLTVLCPESKKYIAGNILLQWTELLLNAVMTAVIAYAFEKIFLREWTAVSLRLPVLIILCTVVLRFFTTRYAARMSHLASRTVKQKLRERIYSKLLKLGTGYRAYTDTAAIVQESVEGVDQLESYFGLYVPQFFYAFLAPLTLFFLFILAGSVRVALVLLICVPLIPGAIMMVQKIAKKILSKYWGQYTQLGSTFLENLQGMTTLKTYQADAYKQERMNEESERFRIVTMKVLTMQLNSITIMDFVAYGGAGLGILLATRAFAAGTLTVSGCLFMILLSAEYFLPMRRLGSYFHVAMNGMAASDKIFSFLGEEEPPGKNETVTGGEIVFDGVSFSYDEKRTALQEITCVIRPDSFTGIVGESGSGKSTMALLLAGRRAADMGTVTIDCKDINRISEDALMRTVTCVGTNSFFFKGTVRENLLLAKKDATDARLWQVLADCHLSAFLREADGLDTALTENASNLSGGQRQRLALARALLHDTPVFLFDEATSNIDIESEEAILDVIRSLAGKKTVIMISHRLSNVTEADQILCMEHGKIAECGTHTELLAKEGVYASLWKTQQELEHYGEDAA